MNDKCPNALSMLGDLELKNDDWVKAKETLRAASEATEGKDSYAILSLVCILSIVHASFTSLYISGILLISAFNNYFVLILVMDTVIFISVTLYVSHTFFGIGKGNWNYFAAIRNEKRNPKLEATHLEKAKELYTRV